MNTDAPVSPPAAAGWGFAALLLAISLTPGPAQAQIAFTALVDGVWTVHWQSDLRARPRPIRSDLGIDAAAPAISPDARRIAFELPGKTIMICALPAADRCETLDSGSGWAARPAWASSSGELAFARYQADARGEDSEIFLTRNGLESIRPLIAQTGNQDDPDVSPDGRRLAYSSAQTVALHRAGVRVVRHLWLMDLADGSARLLVPGAYQDMQPDWCPDGQHIAFASDRSGRFEIWRIDLRDSAIEKLTSGPGLKTWPACSPDGTRIMYAHSHEGRRSVRIVAVDGGESRPFEPFGSEAGIALRDPDWR